MALEAGDAVWIPCRVAHSAFPDERNVSIDAPGGRWVGRVDVRQLRDATLDGDSAIRATVVRLEHGKVAARLPGQTTPRQYLTLEP
jgi:hypothetical protein